MRRSTVPQPRRSRRRIRFKPSRTEAGTLHGVSLGVGVARRTWAAVKSAIRGWVREAARG